MTTSGPWAPTPHGSDGFDRLWAACLDCGLLEPTISCECCGVPGRPAPSGGGPAGSRLWFVRRGAAGQPPRLSGATLVADRGRWLTSIHDDGETRVDEEGNERAWWDAPRRDNPAEQLLVAAIHWRLPEVAARAVRSRARQQLDEEDRPRVLRFAAIAAANGHPELLDDLDLRPATLTWFEALELARAGNDVAACQQALLLEAGTFPARLGLWARAAGQLPDELRAAILARLADFRGNVEVDAAVAATRQALTAGAVPPLAPPQPPAPPRSAPTSLPPLPATVDELCEALRHEDHDGWFTNLRLGLAGVPTAEAVERLSRLGTGATSPARRVACANLALDLIEAAPPAAPPAAPLEAPPAANRSTAGSNELPGPVPTVLRDALREMLTGPIDDPSFRRFARLLADHDAAWTARLDQRADLSHATSVPTRFFAARARGLPAAVAEADDLLGDVFLDRRHPWFGTELQRLRTAALAASPDDPAVRQAVVDHRRFATRRWDRSGDPTELTLLVDLAVTAAGPGSDHATIELLMAAADRLGRLQELTRTALATSWRQLADLERDVQALGSRSSQRALRRSYDPAWDEAVITADTAVSHLHATLGRLHPHAPADLQAAYAATLQQIARLRAALHAPAKLSRRRARRDRRRARSRPPEQP